MITAIKNNGDVNIENASTVVGGGKNEILYARKRHRNHVLRAMKKMRETKTFKKMFRFGKWRFYITRNLAMRPKSTNDKARELFDRDFYRRVLFNKRGGKCEICGKDLCISDVEMHHVLPFSRFPRYAMDERNLLILCHFCHKEIHCNPYKEIRLMESKAIELDVDLKEYYDV